MPLPLKQVFTGLCCLSTTIVFAQLGNTTILGQSTGTPPNATALFLLIPPDARASGMGNTGAASEPDANSVYWNPAKLTFIKDTLGFSVSYAPWLRQLVPDINFSDFSAFYKLKNNQTLGASVKYFSYGNSFTNTVKSAPGEYAITINYSKLLSNNWSAAITGNYLYSVMLAGSAVANYYSNRSIAAGISTYYRSNTIKFLNTTDTISAGICISNMGPKIKYPFTPTPYFLPTNLRLGAAYTMHIDNFTKLSLLLDVNKLLVPTPPIYQSGSNGQQVIASGMNPNVPAVKGMIQSFYDAPGGALEEFHEITWSTGIEYSYADQFAFRAGFFYENPIKGGREYYTLGAGFTLNLLHIDAAYLIPISDGSPLQNTLFISIGFYFSQRKTAGNSIRNS